MPTSAPLPDLPILAFLDPWVFSLHFFLAFLGVKILAFLARSLHFGGCQILAFLGFGHADSCILGGARSLRFWGVVVQILSTCVNCP